MLKKRNLLPQNDHVYNFVQFQWFYVPTPLCLATATSLFLWPLRPSDSRFTTPSWFFSNASLFVQAVYTNTYSHDKPRLSFCILWERIARDRKPLWRNELPRKLPYKLLCRLLRTESYHPCELALGHSSGSRRRSRTMRHAFTVCCRDRSDD